jgi:hypothetical protein
MALEYKPTKLPKEVIDKIKQAVKEGKFTSDNNAIVEILKKYFKIK